jgi:hypothetical protein
MYELAYTLFAAIAIYVLFTEKQKKYPRVFLVGFWSLPFWGALIGIDPMWLGNIAILVVLSMAVEILILRRNIRSLNKAKTAEISR